jgi:hypothetical protein
MYRQECEDWIGLELRGGTMIAERPILHSVMNEVRRLSVQEQIDLLEKIAGLVRSVVPSEPRRSILRIERAGRRDLAGCTRPRVCGTGAWGMEWVVQGDNCFWKMVCLDFGDWGLERSSEWNSLSEKKVQIAERLRAIIKRKKEIGKLGFFRRNGIAEYR